MGNLRDGGLLIVGVSERQTTWDLTGISDADLATYDPDIVIDVVNSYVSPYVNVDILLVTHCNKKYLGFGIHEFANNPLI
jgi:predicted HTH transcriptional regulator